LGGQVWADSRQQFSSAVAGPHFESVCRDFAMARGRELFGRPVGRVAAGAVTDPAGRGQIEIDVAVLAPAVPGQARSVVSLGEAKWGDIMGVRHLARLRRAQGLLAASGFDTANTVLACYARAGFDAELRAAAGPEVLLADLEVIYG
jgi:hypothetical protein